MEIKHKVNRDTDTGIKQSPLDIFIDREISAGRGHQINVHALRDKNNVRLPPAVCMVIKCCITYRILATKQVVEYKPVTKSLKNIYLSPRLWNEVDYWFRTVCRENESEANVQMLTVLGVEIKKASRFARESMTWDFYEVQKSEA